MVQKDGDELKLTAISREILLRLLPTEASEDVLQVTCNCTLDNSSS